MSLNFNSQGFLHETITLSYEELEANFGTNSRRIEQIKNSLPPSIYSIPAGVSFVSLKEYPEDIDLCFDLTDLDAEKLEQEFPQFFDVNEIGKIRRNQLCHIFYSDENDKRFLHLLEQDRDGNPKGLVKLDLTEILTYYDQKRKTI